MRFIGWSAAAVSVLAMAALALPALGSADKAYAPKNCTKPRIEPRTIYIACGDGNFYVRVKKWSFFNGREAGGKGKAFANDCIPDCADGSFHKYRVKIRLSKVRTSSTGPRRGWTGTRSLTFSAPRRTYFRTRRPAGEPPPLWRWVGFAAI